jgi:hypothetical protein
MTEQDLMQWMDSNYPHGLDSIPNNEIITESRHPRSKSGAALLTLNEERDLLYLMQSAQGIYFYAFSEWINTVYQNNYPLPLTDQDLESGAQHSLAPPHDYMGLIPGLERLNRLGYKDVFLEAKRCALSELVALHSYFSRGIESGEIELRLGVKIANALIEKNYDCHRAEYPKEISLKYQKISKSKKKEDHWILNFDEACNIFITTFAAVIDQQALKNRTLSDEEFNIVSKKLAKYLNSAAHLPRQIGMAMVHRIDFLKDGFSTEFEDDILVNLKMHGKPTEKSMQELEKIDLVSEFLKIARSNTMSTGCPAVHGKISNAQKGNLLQISHMILVKHLNGKMKTHFASPTQISRLNTTAPRQC